MKYLLGPNLSDVNIDCLTVRADCLMYVTVPPEGTPVPSNIAKRAGPYLLGPTLGSSPVKSIVQCLARLEGSDEFYTLKVIATITLYVKKYGQCLQIKCMLNGHPTYSHSS